MPTKLDKSTSESGGWTANHSIARIRKAFAAARRGKMTYHAARYSLKTASAYDNVVVEPSVDSSSSANKDHNTKLSTLSDSRSSALREKAAVVRIFAKKFLKKFRSDLIGRLRNCWPDSR